MLVRHISASSLHIVDLVYEKISICIFNSILWFCVIQTINEYLPSSQITCSELTIETLVQGVKYVQS